MSEPQMHAKRIAMVATDRLTSHPKNPRIGDVDGIVESIKANGFFTALTVQKSTGHVLIGNHRLEAAKRLGLKKVPVIYADVDDGRALAMLGADNAASDRAVYDDERLAGEGSPPEQ